MRNLTSVIRWCRSGTTGNVATTGEREYTVLVLARTLQDTVEHGSVFRYTRSGVLHAVTVADAETIPIVRAHEYDGMSVVTA